jgi:DNA (cytosine-5)-methyltransferase 1
VSLTLTDLFCGAGGSGLGAAAVPGVQLRYAANHWRTAVETHAANFPDTDHDVADISQVDPRRTPRTDILWASPECTNHSVAKGRRREAGQPDLFGETLPDPAAERSRATMWDVPRFAEHHRYRAVVVENVVDAARWVMWPAWLQAMSLLGYAYRVVYLNSMHAPAVAAPRAPQSRDRLYVVFWRRGQPTPDLDVRPAALCAGCGVEVAAVQWWKRPDRPAWGRYRAQYLYRCPHTTCRHSVVEPYADPAAAAIDWSLRGQRIGDRDRPLSAKTLTRIRAGLTRYARINLDGRPVHVRARPVEQPATLTAAALTVGEVQALVVPVEGRDGLSARPAAVPARTQTARLQDALVVPAGGTWNEAARPCRQPFTTRTARETDGIAFIAELRGGHSDARPVTQPLATVTASGNHHMLVRHRTPGTGRQSLVGRSTAAPAVEDCTFRMLEPREIQAAMAFTRGYRVLGTRREQVRQLGNAVTPPAAEWLIRAVADSLGGTS